jgi:hypothetical protein
MSKGRLEAKVRGTPPDAASIAAERSRLDGLLKTHERLTYVNPLRGFAWIAIICFAVSFWPVDKLGGMAGQVLMAVTLIGILIASVINTRVELDLRMEALRKERASWEDAPAEAWLDIAAGCARAPECEAYRTGVGTHRRKFVVAEIEAMRNWAREAARREMIS